ncbi:MAG: hypothetical protein KAT68_17660 [Bacteroidales bacterium]|nr:hypothetical protein [Bacteroidales bacterium]
MEDNKNNLAENNIQDFDSREKKLPGTLYTIILILLIAFLIALGFMYYNQKQKTKEVVAELNDISSEKNKVRNELNELLIEYDDIKTNNDSLNSQLQTEQEKIKKMLKQLKTVKANNHLQIKQYKEELSTLRKVMQHFVHQIDSLNTLNQELFAENTKVKSEYNKVHNEKMSLEEKNENLSMKVEKASVIKTFNIDASGLNKKGKAVKKISKVDKFKVCFTLGENIIAKTGNKIIYVRIARPDELVLLESEDNLFIFEGKEIAYTSKRKIEYHGNDVNICIYYDNKEELIPGSYVIDIFTDGKQIGTKTIELK